MFTLLDSFGLFVRIFRYASDVLYLKYLRFNLFQYAVFKVRLRKLSFPSGDGEIRTHDPLLARQVLSQLSYTPTVLFFCKPFGQWA